VVAKVEWHQGELWPRVGFMVTNPTRPNRRAVKFYNGRGTAEQWISCYLPVSDCAAPFLVSLAARCVM
jgi:hypothetical protein